MKKLNPHQWDDVPPIVPGQRVFTPDQMRLMLGGIGKSTYHDLRTAGHLKYSRTNRGRMIVHTWEQYLDYINYLNTKGEVNGDRSTRRRQRLDRATRVDQHQEVRVS